MLYGTRSSWQKRRACLEWLNQARELSRLPRGKQRRSITCSTRTLRIRQPNGLDFSTVSSTSPLRAGAILALTNFHEDLRVAGPKRQPRLTWSPHLLSSGGQGVHREVESERHEEKYRAVIDGGTQDEPVGQRWGKVESALLRRRRSHSPTAPRCLRTARYGRTARDLRRTGRVSE